MTVAADPYGGWAGLDELCGSGPPRTAETLVPGRAAVIELAPPPPRPWRKFARPEQLAVADSTAAYTFLVGGRGLGKTYCGSNTLAEWAMRERGTYAIVAPTFGDCRALCVEGPSGILVALGAPNGEPGGDLRRYDKSKFELELTNGSLIIMASDEAPGRLRGPNLTGVWADEIGSFKRIKETWEEGVEFATRIGSARKVLTGTPKRGHKLVKEYHDRGMDPNDLDVLLVRGRTMDNAANLSEVFLRTIRAKYEGTTLGRQELEGLLLPDAEGALVTTALIDATRCRPADVPDLARVVVAVDPAVTSRESSDHCGIVVVGLGGPPGSAYLGSAAKVHGEHLYVLADESLRASPREWAARVLKTAEMWAADLITAETNNGGELVATMLQLVAEADGLPTPRYVPVWASVGKRTRAEPMAGVWEQGRVHVVGGLSDVEDQWAGWTPGDRDSPDQLDACVAEGTLVATERGDIPVEGVRVGERVWTRSGLRSVLWSGCTREDAEVFEVRTECGGRLVATGDHRVWTARGWVRVDALVWGDVMLRRGLPMTSPLPAVVGAGGVRVLSGAGVAAAVGGGRYRAGTGLVRVDSVGAVGCVGRVYDLTVQRVPEFFAGGLLVHNCVWGGAVLLPQLAVRSASVVRVLASG